MNTHLSDLDDVLDSIMLEEAHPSYDALVKWSAQYPQFANDLSKFFAQWAIQAERVEETEVNDERLSNLAVSHALEILHRRGKKQLSALTTSAVRLLSAIAAVGGTAQSVAAELRLDEMLLKKLDLRRLTEVPETLCKSLGKRLGLSADSVRSMVAGGPPIANAAAHYKAKVKPAASRETFISAIQHSSLSDEEKAYWTQTVQGEKSDRH